MQKVQLKFSGLRPARASGTANADGTANAGSRAHAVTAVAIAVAIAAAVPTLLLTELALRAAGSRLGTWGWIAALSYLAVSNGLLILGLRRCGAGRFGAANTVTSIRSTLVGATTGLVAAGFAGVPGGGGFPESAAVIPVPLLIGLVVPALALDGVDGWVARRTGSSSELGARFDMEVDAFLLLVLSAHVARELGFWVLAIGMLRYAFVAAGWIWPRLRCTLPYRYWRKVAAACAGIALAFAVSGLLPGLAAAAVALALLLLLESFGRDLIWLLRHRDAG